MDTILLCDAFFSEEDAEAGEKYFKYAPGKEISEKPFEAIITANGGWR